MSNYKETNIAGTQWKRSHRVIIDNPLNGSPRVIFMEQTVNAIQGGDTITQPAGQIEKNFDPYGVIDLINPLTGAPTGQTITQMELHVILYSLYIQLAIERDLPPVTEPEESPVE